MTDHTFRSDMDVELVDFMGSDASVVRAARVSTVGQNESTIGQGGLIDYLMRNRHGSPFEHVSFTFYISAPLFVFREWHRHRAGWSYNEESGRYKQLEPVFYVPDTDRKLRQVGKTGHYTFEPGNAYQQKRVVENLTDVATEAYECYSEMLDIGVAKEVARMCLPVNIYSSMYATCNARSLMHFLSLRTYNKQATNTSHPQREIEMVAEGMERIFKNNMPLTWSAWNVFGRSAP